MNRIIAVVVLVVVFAGAYAWYAHQRPVPTSTVATAPTPSPEQAKQDERLELFGKEAQVAGTQWRDSGLGYRIIAEGTAPKPGIGMPVKVKYVGRLKDGTVFDQSDKPTEFLIGATVPGLSTGLQMLGTGGKAVFLIPPSLGYGNRKVMGIPAGSALIFDVEVVAVNR